MVFSCNTCGKVFTQLKHLVRHQRETHEPNHTHHECPECGGKFARKPNLDRHIATVHAKKAKLDVENPTCGVCQKTCKNREILLKHLKTHEKMFECPNCKLTFTRVESLNRHLRLQRCEKLKKKFVPGFIPPSTSTTPDGPSTSAAAAAQTSTCPATTPAAAASLSPASAELVKALGFKEVETAFECRLRTLELQQYDSSEVSLQVFLTIIFGKICGVLEHMLELYSAIKANLVVECEFTNIAGETCEKNFKTANFPIFKTTDLGAFCSDMFQKLVTEQEECQMKGSGWAFVKVKKFQIRINKYVPLRGAGYIQLPKHFKGVINTRNVGNECFKYAILAPLVDGDATNPANFTRELAPEINWQCISFPVALKDIPAFERKNDFSINVFGLDKECKLYPLKVCNEVRENHRDLLFFSSESGESHYAYISDFESLVHFQLTKDRRRVYICKRCFSHFGDWETKLGLTGEQRLAEHERFCGSKDPVRLDLSPDPNICFKNVERSQRVRFSIFADFECALKPLQPTDPQNSNPNTHIHIPHSYAYLIRDSNIESSVIRTHRGADVAKHFVSSLEADVQNIGDTLYANRQLYPKLTTQEKESFNAATQCHICGKEFSDEGAENFKVRDMKVRDHMHSAPYSYRGAAHASCNLRHQEQNTITCYFHNLAYDSHFIINELACDKKEISVIASSEEKYITFTKYLRYRHSRRGVLKVRFVDTLRFLPSSLAQLASNLPKDCFRETRKQFPNQEEFDLLTRKGVFPYSYVTSLETLDEPQLPPKHAFDNSLTLEGVSDSDYAHAENVWRTFNIQDLGQYSDLYLLTDVLLLADVFENFRDTSLKTHKLDPAYYVTLPSYAWDCMLQKTGVSLDTVRDFDMQHFFENGIRGGISQCCKRQSKANNKDCPGWAPEDPSKYITYLDANNLYGWAMSQHLPTGGLRWLDQKEIESLRIGELANDGPEGYIFEVDIEYPASLHNQHRDLPFLCEHKIPPGGKLPKLLTTLEDKKNYIIHYRLLKQALKHGLVLKKIHRVVRFDQSPWLKPYIDMNTELRKSAKNDFERDLFKLFNNSVFGKFMENLRKRLNLKLVTSDKRLEKLISKPNFLSRTIFSEKLAAVHMAMESIVLEKPIYVGLCILDLSKELMYSFFYDTIQPHYGVDNVRLLYMDTDSFILELLTNDLHQSFLPILDHFDTSSYPPENPAYSPVNAKVLGKMKDEVSGKQVCEFVGLRSKMYCIDTYDAKKKQCLSIKRCKGISKAVVKKQLKLEHYQKCVQEQADLYTTNTNFRSKLHQVFTRSEHKLTLSARDDKRHICTDGIDTVAHGHYGIGQLAWISKLE